MDGWWFGAAAGAGGAAVVSGAATAVLRQAGRVRRRAGRLGLAVRAGPCGRAVRRWRAGWCDGGGAGSVRWEGPTARRAGAVLAGAGVLAVVGGPGGLLAGAVVAALCWRLLPEPPTAAARARGRELAALARQLPLTADLLAGCLSAWCAPQQAAEAVAAAIGEPMASRLRLVADELAVGGAPEEVWARFGAAPGLEPLGRCLLRAAQSGAPPAAALGRLAGSAREARRAAAQARVRRAGVLATAPLGLCFLPAFVLVGVVPVVAGLTGGFLGRI